MKIVTRDDFDGLVCSVLLKEAEDIKDIRLVHPKKIEANEVDITSEDIIANLPYHPDCGMWFGHHISEGERKNRPESFKGSYGLAPSCARLIYEYYNLPKWKKYSELITAVDKVDRASLDLNDILRPKGWIRLANTVDPRSGFNNSIDYFLNLVKWISAYPVERILAFDDVRDKSREYFKRRQEYEETLKLYSYLEGTVVITDFRSLKTTPPGNRFLVYALYPTANVSARVFLADDSNHVVIAVGHSILNRTCDVNIGSLMAEYGGGGHIGAGSCRVTLDEAESVINKIVQRIRSRQA